MIQVTALGELLIDFAPLSADESGYPTLAAHPGGAPANFLAALNCQGVRTALLGKVGDDAFGRLLLSTLKEAGIETRGVVTDPEVFTTLAFVTLDEAGDRSFSFARKPGADTCLRAEELDLSLIEEAKVFHFGSLSLTHEPARTATRQALTHAKARGKLITYDPNLRTPLWKDLEEAKEQLLWGLYQADIIKLSDGEGQFLFGLDPARTARHILTQTSAKAVFVTCGADGCHYANRVCQGHVPAPSGIKAADTTGAGDIFGGTLLAKLLELGADPAAIDHRSLEYAVTYAVTAASLSTQTPGGISSVPSPAQILARLP